MNQSPNLLDESLGFNALSRVSLPPNRVLLVKDCVETSGAFVLHHLIKRSLSVQSSGVVVFVAFAHPFSHYDRILRKQGCKLLTHGQNDRFLFFDMLKLDCPDGSKGMIELYRKLRKKIDDISSSSPENRKDITIMIDDISLMEVAANGFSDCVLDFLHYCQTLTLEKGCSLVMLNHDDIYSSTEAPSLILQMEYIADIVIKAEPLATGLAADVHGQLTVLNKGITDDHGILRNRVHNFHFKVKENIVDYFYPGSRN